MTLHGHNSSIYKLIGDDSSTSLSLSDLNVPNIVSEVINLLLEKKPQYFKKKEFFSV